MIIRSMSTTYKFSVVMAAYNKGYALREVLESIYNQNVNVEVVICDDTSTDDTQQICLDFPVVYIRLNRDHSSGTVGPAKARNQAFKMASGEIWIVQSADVVHEGETIRAFGELVRKDNFVLATVRNRFEDGSLGNLFCGVNKKRPLFFLGALYGKHVIEVGGDSEDFTELSCEDEWFAECLIHGQQLTPIYTDKIRGFHLSHYRPPYEPMFNNMNKILQAKIQKGVFKNEPLHGAILDC